MNVPKNKVFYESSKRMSNVPNESVELIVTSPPYFNIKDYSKDGVQKTSHSTSNNEEIGFSDDYQEINDNYEKYIDDLFDVWSECHRVLAPNGKLCINVPMLPMKKSDMNTHHNRDLLDLRADMHASISRNIKLHLYDLYIWNRTNSTKNLMFGSYPYPKNIYAQNTSEFITVYVKDGKPPKKYSDEIKERSKLSQEEWLDYTKQIWNIPAPNKGDIAFGKHSAIMPEEIARRCIKLFSFIGDTVLDPFAGSGTTLKVAQELNRNYIGYELYEAYKPLIEEKTKRYPVQFI